MSAAERAALLSARIHREINAGRPPLSPPEMTGHLPYREALDFWFAYDGEHRWGAPLMARSPFSRLGAELRAIAFGNRGRL